MILLLIITQTWTTYVDSALLYLGMTQEDLTFRHDYSVRDPYRFPVVDAMLDDPLTTVDRLVVIDSLFWSCPVHIFIKQIVSYYALNPSLHKMRIDDACASAAEQIVEAFSGTPSELLMVYEELTTFSPDLTTSIEEDKAKEKHQDSLVQYLKEHATTVEYDRLFQAATDLLNASAHTTSWVENLPMDISYSAAGVEGAILYHMNYQWGEVVVGDTCSNTYTGNFALIIDLGGNDEYQCETPDMISVIIDKSGDDTYTGKDFALASGVWGISILIDAEGNDTYTAGNYSLGCGVFGIGILIDEAGDDTYVGDIFTQGSGGF